MIVIDLDKKFNRTVRRDEAARAEVRLTRDRLINKVSWVRQRHLDELALGVATTLQGTEYTRLLDFIQSLRDVPNQQGFPLEVEWPPVPAFIKGITDE